LRVDFCFAVFIVLFIVIYAIGFWAYKDRPPTYSLDISQVAEELRGGWFSFENPLRIKLLFVCSTISILIASIIRFVMMKLKVVQSFL